jgi:uncharacterized protein (TIGR02996 family)
MIDEQGFLNQILADLKDDTARLVYADWLEERGDDASVARAEFLRVECAWARLPQNKRGKGPLHDRLKKLARGIDTDWLAVVSKLAIERCDSAFRFRCPKQWENLKPTADAAVRFCDECKKNVYYCDTIGSARRHARHDECIAVDIGIIRRKGDVDVSLMGMLLGRVSVSYLRRQEELERPDEVSAERERRKAESTASGIV